MTEAKKILIADDERPMAHALELKLTNIGFKVKTSNNGEEALKALDQEHFDLMILDLVMPKINGFDVLKLLNEMNHIPPTIVLSNLGQPEDIDRAKSLGVKKYFIKSETSLVVISQEVSKILRK